MQGMATVTKEEQQWQAESDAETMARYEEILADPKRKQRAVNAAKKRAEELQKRVNIMNNVTKRK